MRIPKWSVAVGLVVLFLGLPTLAAKDRAAQAGPSAQETDPIEGPIVGDPVVPGLSPAVRDLAPAEDGAATNRPRRNPLQAEPDQGQRGTWNRVDVPLDPLIQPAGDPAVRSPGLDFSFEGTGNPAACGTCTPPDTNGDVGPNHYIQMVNATKVAIYNKAGALISGPFELSSLWSSGPCTSDAGDPIVLYDSMADRWLLSQFADPNHMCVAISQTADPTGAYFTYTFNVGSFPDYFKFGVWPDAYYMSANESTYTAYAFNRANMLAGAAATFVKFTGGTNFYLPGDLDGPTLPPAGAPGIFYTFKDNSFHGGADRIEVREFHVDWVTPANSTFTLAANLNIAPFTFTVCGFFNFNCIHQLGTGQTFDAVSEWPMWRFPYRFFASHQTLLGTFTVGGGQGEEGAALRWFELRKTGGGWTLYQEGTHDPADGHDRVMGSIAMDQDGNIALGYSVSSSAIHPAIRYVTRLSTDPLGTFQAEAVLIAPNGSQTGSDRWGDYSAMGIDPANDCTFWYTNQYYPVNSANQWKTRVGVFTIPECVGGATPTPTATGPTPTPTVTFTSTPTAVITATATGTPRGTPGGPTATRTPTNTPPIGPTPTRTPGGTSTPAGTNTGFLSPNANAPVTAQAGDNNGFEVTPVNGQANDSTFAVDNNSGTTTDSACTDRGKDKHSYFNYNISLPGGATIQGIEVRLDARVDSSSNAPKMCVQLSWNGGANWTTAKSTPTLTTSEATYILGGPADSWGHMWQTGQVSNANFRVRITNVASSTARDFSMDWVAVNVHFLP